MFDCGIELPKRSNYSLDLTTFQTKINKKINRFIRLRAINQSVSILNLNYEELKKKESDRKRNFAISIFTFKKIDVLYPYAFLTFSRFTYPKNYEKESVEL